MLYIFFILTLNYCYAHNLVISVSNYKTTQGHIAIAIFKSKQGFPKNAKNAIFINFISFKDLPYKINLPKGEYAISIFHDENNNQKLDTNFMGIPKEHFGFSNDVIGMMGPPSFDRAKIILKDDRELNLKLMSI